MNGPGERLSVKEKLAYGLGSVGSSLIWMPFTMFLIPFYTNVAGLAPTAVGTMFVITRIWRPFIDPLMGVISDRTETRWGKFRPYLLFSALGYGLFGVLAFTSPHLSPTGKLVYASVTYSLAAMVFSAFHVPYSALMGVISPDSQERTSVCSYQFAFAAGGGLILQVVGFCAPSLVWGRHSLFRLPMAMLIMAPLAILLLCGCFAGTKERVKPPRGQHTPLGRDLKDFFQNTPLLILAGTGFCALAAVALRSTSAIVSSRSFVLTAYPGRILRFIVITSACSLAAAFLVQYVTQVLGRKTTYLCLLIATVAVISLSIWVRPDQVQLMSLSYILTNLLQVAIMVVIWSMFADAADYSEWKTGRRATGLVFAAVSVSQSLAWALARVLGNRIFALIGPAAVAATPQVTTSHAGVRMMVSFVPAAAALLSVLIAFFYPLDEKTVKQMATDLSARRAAEAQPA